MHNEYLALPHSDTRDSLLAPAAPLSHHARCARIGGKRFASIGGTPIERGEFLAARILYRESMIGATERKEPETNEFGRSL